MLTTSHKSKFTIDEWKSIFKNRGINIEKIKSLPKNFNNLSRKDEIINWFNVNNVDEDFVIIDNDKSLDELPNFLKENLVQTSPCIGLTEQHLEALKSISLKSLQPVQKTLNCITPHSSNSGVFHFNSSQRMSVWERQSPPFPLAQSGLDEDAKLTMHLP